VSLSNTKLANRYIIQRCIWKVEVKGYGFVEGLVSIYPEGTWALGLIRYVLQLWCW